MKKKILLSLMLMVFVIFAFGMVSASAATTLVESGTFTGYGIGSTLTWEYYSDRSLVIKGTGYMGWFYNDTTGPWPSGCKKVIIEEGVNSIGNNAFRYCTSIEEVHLPTTMKKIGRNVFMDCKNIKRVYIKSIKNWIEQSYYDYDSNPIQNAELYLNGTELCELIIPENVTYINDWALEGCNSFQTIVIPSSLKYIATHNFSKLKNLKKIYYNGSKSEFKQIDVGGCNELLNEDTIIYFYYVSVMDENGVMISTIKNVENNVLATDQFNKNGYSLKFFTDPSMKNEFNLSTPITENLKLYLKYIPNKYNAKFIDDDGTLISEELVDYASVIIPPAPPSKERTPKFTYTFAGWENFVPGETTQTNSEMVFKAKYNATINQYTYKFIDDNGDLLKQETVDYGTAIVIPDTLADKDPYTFDYWQNYTDGMTVTENMTFTAVYKYKNYSVAAEGLSDTTTVTYNSNFTIEPQEKTGYSFVGYFTDKDGKGTQITNEIGESLAPYNVVGDLTVYPYFRSDYINKIELCGETSAMPGDSITYKPIFATDKDAAYFTATVKYPKYLTFNVIKGTADYIAASATKEKIKDNFKTITITCVRDNYGGNAPINTNLVPFELTLDVATDATLGSIEIGIEKVNLIGETAYAITDITNAPLTIKPKLAEHIEITGDSRIDKATKFIATVYPDYTTDKSVTWSVDNASVATISADGILTPVTNGRVTVTATANDEGKISESKTVDVTAYAKITSLTSDTGVWSENFVPENYNYTIYVTKNTDAITLTPSSSGGTLKLNGTDIIIPRFPQEIDLPETETTVTFNRDDVPNMTDNVYTIKIVKFEGTKTTVSDNGKEFSVKPVNVAVGNAVVLALYDNEKFIEMQAEKYNGTDISFTTDKPYTNAKIVIWESLENMKPVCGAETVK